MKVSAEILEELFIAFSKLVSTTDDNTFSNFSSSAFIDSVEGYKYSVYEDARENLGQKWWKPELIGTGKIQEAVASAINKSVNHNFKSVPNNLIDWRKKDNFKKIEKNKALETLLFDFYKSKIQDQEAFEKLLDYKLSYQFIAYLFFIKDRNRFMPISQEKFDVIFSEIGLPDFKTSHNVSWANYATYLDIIKQVRDFLKTKDAKVTLLDAHSFLWIVGNQMKEVGHVSINKAPAHSQQFSTTPGSSSREPGNSSQKSYLFAWNPDKWNWQEIESNIEDIENKGTTTLRWSCRSHKSIRIGDRAFLVKLGDNPKGIIASGYVVSLPFLSPHWSGEDKDVPRVHIEFEVIINPNKNSILNLDALRNGNLSKQHWTPQSSGISIQDDCIAELEATWFDFLSTQNILFNSSSVPPDNLQTFTEGTAIQITQTRYERNPYARKVCLEHYGYSCSVCDFNFVTKYGTLGKDFIHVHHLTQIASIGNTYTVDPIKDLRPVCPNCHAMLHKKNPPLSIEELKAITYHRARPN